MDGGSADSVVVIVKLPADEGTERYLRVELSQKKNGQKKNADQGEGLNTKAELYNVNQETIMMRGPSLKRIAHTCNVEQRGESK